MLRLRLLLSLIIAGVLTLPLQAATITVADDGKADYSSIQAAIDAANNSDEIIVSPGTYLENINFNGKAITVRSASGDPADTIIDGGGNGSVVTCDSGETSTTVLDGFTITNGSGQYGGGMYNTNSSPTVTNCAFSSNAATYGGGMLNLNANPTVTNCTFSGNTANDDGGGMYIYKSSPILSNCTFSGNTANRHGGGMSNSNSSSTVTNCTFSGNTADWGGGMFNRSSSPTITNCILWGDSPDEIDNSGGSTPMVSYSDVQGGWTGAGGNGNISVDPLISDTDGPDDISGTEDDDLRLLSGSPCIDAGFSISILTDLDDHVRVVDDPATTDTGVGFPEVVDMGAYEFGSSPALCISQLEGDINCDGIVNLLDQALLALHWLETN